MSSCILPGQNDAHKKQANIDSMQHSTIEAEKSRSAHRVVVIDSQRRWFNIDFAEIWQARYLIGQFVYRDFVVHYKQTVLGPMWWLLQPVFMTGVFTIVFSLIANIPTGKTPPALFYFCAIVLWNFFASAFQHVSNMFQDYKSIFQKIYFPRLVPAIASILSDLLRFTLQFSLFVLIYVVCLIIGTSLQPDWSLLLLPCLLIYVSILALGLGLSVASLTVKYRDFAFILPFFTQLWMFLSAVIHPLADVPASWRFWFALNPMVPAIESFRFMCFGTGGVSCVNWLAGISTSLLFLFVGLLMFSRVNKTFTDTI